MSKIKIRTTTLEDADAISDCNQMMAMETENKTLPEHTINRGVRRLMEQPQYGFYLIAESDTAEATPPIAGTCMVTTEWSDWRDGLFWWVQSVYVKPEYRKQGVYTAMYNTIKSMAAKQPDICGFRLYVEKDNKVAQKAYESLGMSVTDYLLYEALTDAGA